MSEHFFLVLEGLDGSGKTEISRRLAALLSETLGADHVLLTYEPHNPRRQANISATCWQSGSPSFRRGRWRWHSPSTAPTITSA